MICDKFVTLPELFARIRMDFSIYITYTFYFLRLFLGIRSGHHARPKKRDFEARRIPLLSYVNVEMITLDLTLRSAHTYAKSAMAVQDAAVQAA